ncbi:MAG: bifunctional glutamate N-acetyltransferase/amino-acid acetyltransferase ArgJ [Alphaproteobacteria bacterium]|nr:MAG: bifunctional glutamate N-acetyltransferase/amino-acid acetyltransferase ArgJ [Alphaproteobacteria bacterium]
MGKKAEKLAKLKRKLRKTEKKLAAALEAAREALAAEPKEEEPQVSPLAPPGGFPAIPPITGLRLAAVEAGVRYSGRPDVMLAELGPGSVIAGAFTRSSTRAAPVLDCEAKIGREGGDAGAAILVNAGNANAFTGRAGVEAVAALTQAVAERLGVPQTRVFTSSTGVIGEPLPHERITAKLDELAAALSPMGIAAAARAIMTTDTFPKGAVEVVETPEGPVTIAGIAKGSGMIAPDMATMLVYIFTDARIPRAKLQRLVDRFVPGTFNSITVDSDTSTSDTLLVAATCQGADVSDGRSAPGRAFAAALERVMRDLAQQVVRDGEGATKFVTVSVSGAATDADAKRVAMSIANSPLVKTAIAGEDPNWGRVVMAVGKSGAKADRDRLSIRFGDIEVAREGWVSPAYEEAQAAAYMKNPEIEIGVDLGLGTGQATVWTCDLTHRYIEINADYRS